MELVLFFDAIKSCKSHEEAMVDMGWVGADYRVVSCRCLREDPY